MEKTNLMPTGTWLSNEVPPNPRNDNNPLHTNAPSSNATVASLHDNNSKWLSNDPSSTSSHNKQTLTENNNNNKNEKESLSQTITVLEANLQTESDPERISLLQDALEKARKQRAEIQEAEHRDAGSLRMQHGEKAVLGGEKGKEEQGENEGESKMRTTGFGSGYFWD